MEEPRKRKDIAWPIIVWTFSLATIYAVLRYHILGPVSWKDFPFFILNKAFALCAFILLSFNFAFGPMKNLGISVPNSWMRARRFLGIMGFMFTFAHLLMSFILFNPSIYGHFFAEDGRFTLNGSLSLVSGVLAFIILWLYNISFNSNFRKDKDLISFITSRRVLLPAMFMAGAHLFFMGYKGWLNPSGWHGGLPPISLVGFCFFIVGFVINLMGRK